MKVRDTGSDVWTATTTAKAAYDPGKSSITITELSWSKMTGADKAAIPAFESALYAHENGHLELAKDYLARYYGKYSLLGAGLSDAAAVSEPRPTTAGSRARSAARTSS